VSQQVAAAEWSKGVLRMVGAGRATLADHLRGLPCVDNPRLRDRGVPSVLRGGKSKNVKSDLKKKKTDSYFGNETKSNLENPGQPL
jgi:hypothetical protein